MITFVRSAEMQDGKGRAAIEWALKVTAYINETFGTNISVQENIGGKVGQIHWVNMTDSMNDALEILAKLGQDEGYQALVAESNDQGLFFGQSIVDHYYQSLS